VFICGQTGILLKAEPIFKTDFYTVYNVFNKKGDFLYRTTEENKRMSEQDNLSIINGFDKIKITPEELVSRSCETRNRKLNEIQVRKIREMHSNGMKRSDIVSTMEVCYSTVEGIINNRIYTEVM